MAIEVKADRTREMLKAVENLTKMEVLVGIPAGSDRTGGGPTNAMLGYVHEYGSPARNIPARPFLHPGIRAAQSKIEAVFRKGADAALSGDEKAGDVALNSAGLIGMTEAKKMITSGNFAPLKPATIAARRRKGFYSEKPLVVTASLLNSITYVIRPKER